MKSIIRCVFKMKSIIRSILEMKSIIRSILEMKSIVRSIFEMRSLFLKQFLPLFNGSLSAPQVRYISWSLFPYTVPRSTLNKNWKCEEKYFYLKRLIKIEEKSKKLRKLKNVMSQHANCKKKEIKKMAYDTVDCT